MGGRDLRVDRHAAGDHHEGAPVVIALAALLVLAFFWAWHLDRKAKRQGSRDASPADLIRGAYRSRTGTEATKSGGGCTGRDEHL